MTDPLAPDGPERDFLRHYDELRQLARRLLDPVQQQRTLGATALVHEAWLRLAGANGGRELAPDEFLRMATTAMRNALLDHVRARGRLRRGGKRTRLSLDAFDLAATGNLADIADVDEAIEKLQQQDAEAAEVVRLRFYSGLRMDETAAALGRSERSVHRAWAFARAWLYRELGVEDPP